MHVYVNVDADEGAALYAALFGDADATLRVCCNGVRRAMGKEMTNAKDLASALCGVSGCREGRSAPSAAPSSPAPLTHLRCPLSHFACAHFHPCCTAVISSVLSLHPVSLSPLSPACCCLTSALRHCCPSSPHPLPSPSPPLLLPPLPCRRNPRSSQPYPPAPTTTSSCSSATSSASPTFTPSALTRLDARPLCSADITHESVRACTTPR